MAKIHVLDTHTANRIAAGEVVERPASAIKELIENAIDAGANAITAEIRAGGIEYMRVTDNGSGLLPEDIRVAFERHATSKIRSGDTLESIGSLGFRGEALPSIAAVSRLEMTSRRREAQTGVRIQIEGGEVISLREAGSPEGTTLVVRDLFFNTPARKKFLKRPVTEAGYVGDAVLRQALARPEISFRFINNGKTMYHTPGDGSFIRAMEVLFGREISSQIVNISGEFFGYSLAGAIGLQDAARANRQHEFIFINGRYIQSPLISLAMEEAVKGHIAIGKYPFAVLYLTVPPNVVDINVHPNKLEVRFRDELAVRNGVMDSIRHCLSPSSAYEPVPMLPVVARDAQKTNTAAVIEGASDVKKILTPPPERKAIRVMESGDMLPPMPPMPSIDDAPPERVPPPERKMVRGKEKSDMLPPVPSRDNAPSERTAARCTGQLSISKKLPVPEPVTMPLMDETPRVIGALFSTYLLAQVGEAMYIVDQHAAHERLLYDEYMRILRAGEVSSQGLLAPYQFRVTPIEAAMLAEHIEMLGEMGFEISEFGESAFRVDAVPHLLGEPQMGDFILELVAGLERLNKTSAIDKKRDEIARIACHRAVKAGDALMHGELKELLKKSFESDAPMTCPHGRPILLRITKAELEKRFRRVQ